MSSSKYFKNYILCGITDFHCLLCKESFNTMTDVEKHVRWEKHRKVMKTQTYLHKFKKDFISKVDNNVYCEVCNFVFYDVKAIPDHIKSEQHLENKSNPDKITAKEQPNAHYEIGRVIVNDKKVPEFVWHGISENKCVICDKELEGIKKHCTSSEHVIKLIQSEIGFENEQGYRKVKPDSYHCFMCGNVFEPAAFSEHFCCKPDTAETAVDECESAGRQLFNLILETNKAFQAEADNPESTVPCEVCNEEIPCDLDIFFNHMQKHNLETRRLQIAQALEPALVIIDRGKRRAQLAAYGRINYIKLNAGGSKGFCVLCSKFLSPQMMVFKSHVEGAIHTGHLQIRNINSSRKPDSKKYTPLNKFVKYMLYYKDVQTFYINTCISIKNHSFMFMNKIDHGPHFKRTKCYACDVSMDHGTEYLHCRQEDHKKNVMSSVVILHEDGNFIREVRPNLYHCSCCNVTFPFMHILRRHLTTHSHNSKIPESDIGNILVLFHKKYGVPAYPDQLAISSNIDNLYNQIMKAIYGRTT